MHYQKYKNINQYEQLINYLKPKGLYQIRLIICFSLYWFISGLSQSLFDLSIAWEETLNEFIVQETAQAFSVLLAAYFSLYFSRSQISQAIVAILVLGSIVLLIGMLTDSAWTIRIGLFSVITFHYSLAFIALMIVLQYYSIKAYNLLLLLALASFTIGKMVAVWIYSGELNALEIYFTVITPCSLVYLISLWFFSESPRFLIDHDIAKAEKLLKQISQTNKIPHQSITVILQRQFFWNKVSLRKYNFQTLLKFNSISYNTYILSICAIFYGIVCRCPDFIQRLQTNTSFDVQDSVEIVWVSSFQMCGLLPSYISTSVMRRKTLTVTLSIVLLIISSILVCLQQVNFNIGDTTLYSLAILGLNSFFSATFFYVLLLSAIQFYPHTVRTLACGLILCCYKLGKLPFSVITNNLAMMQLVLCCSLLLVLHICLMKETLNQQGKYEIAEIEEQETEEY